MKEVSSNEDLLEYKDKNMKFDFVKNMIIKALTPIIEDVKKELGKSRDELIEEKNRLVEDVNNLAERVSQLSDKLNQNKEKVDVLFADYNTRNASSDSKYRAAIDEIFRLNSKFINSVPKFGREGNLEKLQLLVKYLFDPKEDLRTYILDIIQNDDKSINILNEIDVFNDKSKLDLIKYLSKLGKKWEDCILFPEEFNYNPKTMCLYNDLKIEKDAPIYVVSLGNKFPNSNSEDQLPIVLARTNYRE